MDFAGIVISVIIALITIILVLVGIILLFSTSTSGKYKWESPSIAITVITIVSYAFFLKFAYDDLFSEWMAYAAVLLVVLNPLLASVGAYETKRNLMENIAGIIFLFVAFVLILV